MVEEGKNPDARHIRIPEVGQQHSTEDTGEQGGMDTTAESEEGRALTERNAAGGTAVRTQGRGAALSGLCRVRQRAQRDKEVRFTALLHHITPELLTWSFYQLRREAAIGVDKVTWEKYREKLTESIQDLHEQVHRGSYRAQPVRRMYIEKDDGGKRALGIAALEDKIVQQAVVKVLNQIYESDFKGFSYGFREGRSAHDALDALYVGIEREKVNWVLDADIESFFDSIDHEWMMKFLGHRIGDKRILRLIRKWLKTGYIEDGKRVRQEVGIPQGSVISPLLANIYLHYTLDLWVEKRRKKEKTGRMIIVRYADDFIIGFQYRRDALEFQKELEERLKRFRLKLHAEKTRIIEFGRYAESNRRRRGEGKPENFEFLGFTHICSRNKKGGFFMRRKTNKKRFAKKCREIKKELKRRMHGDVRVTGIWLRSVIIGHQNFYAVPGNMTMVKEFYNQTIKVWLQTLRRRSQKGQNLTWERYNSIKDRLIPKVRLVHPFPNVRFDAKHSR